MRCLLRLPAILVALAVVSLSGCTDGEDEAAARVRLLNASSGYQSLDLYVNADDSDSDSLKSEGVAFAALGNYTEVESGTYDVKFKRNGISSTLLTLSDEQLADDSDATYVAYGPSGRFGVMEIDEDVEAPSDSDRSKLQVLNVSEAGAVDVYLTDSEVALEDASPLFSGVADSFSMLTTDRGDYRLRVTAADDASDVRLDIPTITLQSKKVASLILTETTGGALVDAIMLPQGGSLTQYTNTKARVRGAVGMSTGAQATLTVGGITILSRQTVGLISAYSQVDAGSVAVSLSVDSTDVPVDNQTLVAGGDYTVLIWSDSSGTRVTLVTDNNHLPTDTSDAKIRLLNGFSTQGVPLDLAVDYAPVAQNIELGQASGYAEVSVNSGGDYRIDVDNSDNGTDVVIRDDVTLQASGVYTLLVTGSGTTAQSTLRKDR